MAAKPDYGIDAPGVVRNNLGIGAVLLLLLLVTPPAWRIGGVTVMLHSSFAWMGGWLIGIGLLMLLYARVGKFRHRDRMLALHAWTGQERVLDVGTGRGLLLVGAAKRLTTGSATGIDIWNREDLSGNSEERTLGNMRLEGVAERCTLLSENATQMSFADESFDVVLSNLCLHNIYDKALRQQACREIARVLAPGGAVILSDYKLTREYAATLRAAALDVRRAKTSWFTTFPPLTVLVGRKPGVSYTDAARLEPLKQRAAAAEAPLE